MKLVPTLLALVLCCAPWALQAQQQMQLDTATALNGIVSTGVLASNGDRVLFMAGGNDRLLWRAQGDGVPLWTREVSSGRYPSLVADMDGGTILAQMDWDQHFGEVGLDEDTTRMTHHLTRIASDGGLVWEKGFSFDIIHPVTVFLSSGQTTTLDAEGNIFVAIWYWQSASTGLVVVKLSTEGTVLWSKEVGQASFGVVSWDHGPGFTEGRLAPDGNGGVHVVSTTEYPDIHPIKVAHLTADGTLDRFKSYTYAEVSSTIGKVHSITLAPDGRLSLVGTMGWFTPPTGYTQVLNLGEQGEVTDAHFYPGIGTLLDRKAQYRNDGHLFLSADTVVVEFAADGEVLHAARIVEVEEGQVRKGFHALGVGVSPEGAFLPGTLLSTNMVFGTSEWVPAYRIVDPAQEGCGIVPFTLEHVVVPTEYYAVTDLTDAASVDIVTTAVEGPGICNVRPIIGSDEICATTVGIAEMAASDGPQVENTLVSMGDAIRLGTGPACRVNVLDAQGREMVPVTSYAADVRPTIATAGWPAGVYLVRVSDSKGEWDRTQRVVVTR